jgi:hypothetical protein
LEVIVVKVDGIKNHDSALIKKSFRNLMKKPWQGIALPSKASVTGTV